MALLIGTDEAGYGPNLGPLVISATAWQVPDELGDADLFELLRSVVARDSKDGRIAIADSKILYKPGGGLAALERGVLASLGAGGHVARSWRDLWQVLCPTANSHLDSVPWYAGYDEQLPIDEEAQEISLLASRLGTTLADAGVHLQCVRAVAVFPSRFNRLLDRHTSKGSALSNETLQLVRDVMDCCPASQVLVRCDKHGGRNRYGPLLQTQFPEHLVEIRREGRGESIYRWGPASRRIEIRFVAKCESFLPTALASMVAKYLRELAMRAFNAFWHDRVTDLRPTAGYPVDAKRFRQEIRQMQTDLGIEDRILWRNK